jgi:prevent-host-death family protein
MVPPEWTHFMEAAWLFYGAEITGAPKRSPFRSKTATLPLMADVPVRELRNDVSGVLRRVEGGERLRVTVSGRPVAELVPLPGRPRSIRWDDFIRGSEAWRAHPGLARELRDHVPETTDDLPHR